VNASVGPTWTNIAGDNASVGVQSAVIHGGVDYYASGDTQNRRTNSGFTILVSATRNGHGI
jgi:hypothetical protein